MELTKQDTKMTKGLAIIFMVLLHLFCRTDNLPYDCLKIGGIPLIYYLGLFADQCVAIYCFCSGYAMYLINEKVNSAKDYYKGRLLSVLKFLINYWVVLIVFSILGIFFDKSGSIPGNATSFIKNFLVIDNSYNGAWWFVFTYILLVLISRPCYAVVKKLNPIIVLAVSGVIYLGAYYQRTTNVIKTGISVVDWAIVQLALLGTSILPYIIAMMFYKYRIFTKLRNFISNHTNNLIVAIVSIVLVLLMMVAHGIVQSLIVAPLTGIATITLFNLVNKGKIINKIFEFFGDHSTNIWLVHMFFYSQLFKDLVFVAKYPLFIFAFMMGLCIASSYVIQFINKQVLKVVKL
ncbi:acyltransferase [uncultured Eubacterium sp.]|uniref:acyltransferase family protein n=1 Tax=uncultured Eubacterium sp. TaxID=165185 RepID=UPI0025DB9A4A|nr:acyltransferase [uncultured Eubacterium sp.]